MHQELVPCAMRRMALAVLLLVSACGGEGASAPETHTDDVIATPAALIEAMHARYDGAWYTTLTFVQETVQYRQDGRVDTSTWYEAYEAPGRLRIDFAPLEAGNGLLFASDSQYVFQNGEIASARPSIHPLLLLGFDVYHLRPEETLAKLDTLGFDLSTMHEATWQGRPHYVVGAAAGDERSPQFWIDREHLYFTRMLRPIGPGGQIMQETLFNNYERVGGGWVAPEVVFNVDGERVMLETYNDVQTGMTFIDHLFDPSRWQTAEHWLQAGRSVGGEEGVGE